MSCDTALQELQNACFSDGVMASQMVATHIATDNYNVFRSVLLGMVRDGQGPILGRNC